MSKEHEAKLLGKIAKQIEVDHDGELKTLFLYVEAGPQWTMPLLVVEEADRLVDIDLSRPVFNDLHQLWEVRQDNAKWFSMKLEIANDRFKAHFDFANDIPHELQGDDKRKERRDHIIRARFGDKPVVYTPPPGWAQEFRPAS